MVIILCYVNKMYFIWKTRGNPEDDLIKTKRKIKNALEFDIKYYIISH